MDNPIILKLAGLTIFSLMLGIGVNHSFQQIVSLWRQPHLLLRSLLAVIVLVPLLVILILLVFDLSPEVAIGLAVLAASPGAPLMSKRIELAGGEPVYAASLQLTLALLAVVSAPLTLTFFALAFDLADLNLSPLEVVRQVAQVTFLPVIVGLLIQRFSPRLAAVVARPIRVVANLLFFVLFILLAILLVLTPSLRMMLNIGVWPTAAVIIMVCGSLAAGQLLGGRSREQSSVLAIACAARNVGLALFIADLSDYGYKLIPVIFAYMLLGALLALPYSLWIKKQIL